MSTNLNPTPPPASTQPKKPIEGRMIGFLLVGVLAVAVLLTSVVSLLTTSAPKAQPGEVQAPAGKPVVAKFGADVDQAAAVIAQNAKAASQVATVASDLHAKLPPCNEQMRTELHGQYYVLRSQNPEYPADVNMACLPNDQWQTLPPAVGQIQPETPAQMTAETHGTPTGGMSQSEKRKMRLEAAERSNPIPLHFADPEKSADAPVTAEAKPLLPQPQPLTAPAPEESNNEDRTERKPELGVELSKYNGPRYPLFQGRILEGLLVNRLIGDQDGPVKVQITTPVYSQDTQHLLIPPGSVLLGESAKVTAAGEQRLAVVFHRVIMPDGWSFMLTPTKGLDQQGAAGLTGKVNRHLASLISTAVMVGAIEGLADFTSVGTGSAFVEIQSGVSRESSNESMQILRNALNRPPGVTVFEGTRVRVWVTQDQALPDYQNHQVTLTVE